jgi:hypothetical protein
VNKRVHVDSGAISIQEYLVLEAVAVRLARRYPPDWLERQGRTLYLATLALSFLVAVLAGLAWGPWWGFLIPLFMPTIVLVLIPQLLFGRVAGRPRWAHRLALLDRRDAELVRRTVAALEHCDTISGDRFFHVWVRAHYRMQHRRG